jgi:hypothetical protein
MEDENSITEEEINKALRAAVIWLSFLWLLVLL